MTILDIKNVNILTRGM